VNLGQAKYQKILIFGLTPAFLDTPFPVKDYKENPTNSLCGAKRRKANSWVGKE
jgi:hypothetical protein